MLKTGLAAVMALVLAAAGATADEIKGKVKKIDADKNTVVLTVDDKDTTYDVAKDAKITTAVPGAKKKDAPTAKDVEGGLKGLKVGDDATLTVEKKDGKEVATAIKLSGAATVKKKKTKTP